MYDIGCDHYIKVHDKEAFIKECHTFKKKEHAKLQKAFSEEL